MPGEPFLMTEAAANIQMISTGVFLVILTLLIYGMALSRRHRFRGAHDWMMAIPMAIFILHTCIYYLAVWHARCGFIGFASPITSFTTWSVMLRLHEGVTILGGVLHWVVLIRERAKNYAVQPKE